MKLITKILPAILLLAFINQPVNAEIKANTKMINQWNQFVDDLLTLSNSLTKKTAHTEILRTGGYSNLPEFYNETKYINNTSNSVTSIVQRERTDQKAVHSIEVFLRDDQARITKDFSASYLTTHRNAPIQTLITLHYYNKELHGFRVFDASHERIYEVCRGKLNGKTINIDLDDNYGELAEALEDKKGIMSSTEYKACFGGRDYDPARLKIPLK